MNMYAEYTCMYDAHLKVHKKVNQMINYVPTLPPNSTYISRVKIKKNVIVHAYNDN